MIMAFRSTEGLVVPACSAWRYEMASDLGGSSKVISR